jgi:hypothetical protein
MKLPTNEVLECDMYVSFIQLYRLVEISWQNFFSKGGVNSEVGNLWKFVLRNNITKFALSFQPDHLIGFHKSNENKYEMIFGVGSMPGYEKFPGVFKIGLVH